MSVASEFLAEASRRLWQQSSFSFLPDRQLPAPQGTLQRNSNGPRVLFAGFPSDYSLAFLYALLPLDVDVVGIVTSPGAHPAILGDNALSRIADHLEIQLLRLWRVNDEHARQDIARLRPEAVIMASFDQIIGARALAIPTHGWLNIHPSALPDYRGPEPVYWAIADGVRQTGITLHRAVPRFDAGPVLAQRLVSVEEYDTGGTLTRRLCAAGVEVVGEAVARLLAGDPGQPLDLDKATYRPSVGHRRLERASSAAEAERMVRAGVPNMPAWTVHNGRPTYVLAAHVVDRCPEGTGLQFTDGCLTLDETAASCRCHHNDPECPHREDVE